MQRVKPVLWLGLVVALLSVSGCEGGGSTPSSGATQAMKGMIHGGQQPVSGSLVTLYEVSTTAFGGTPTQIAQTTTGSDGTFSIASFNCTPNNANLYITAVGGNPGSGTNSAIGMMAGLGACNALPSFVNINEVTTVASIWALNQFIDSTGQKIGCPSTDNTGLSNAMATIASTNLVDITTGLAPTSFATGVSSPTSELYTLANILAECINQSGPSSTACQRLFCDATSGATWNGSSCSTTPTISDTLAAALSIARNPANNVSDLFLIPSTFVPFSPTLSSAPTDWLLAVGFDAIGGLSSPTGIAIDSSGDIWVANQGNDSLTELSPVGRALSPSSGYNGGGIVRTPASLAIDNLAHIWVTDSGHDNVVEVAISDGSGLHTYDPGNALHNPFGVTFVSGSIWVTNSLAGTDTVVALDTSGNPLSGSPFSGGGLNSPQAIAGGNSGSVWVSGSATNSLSSLSQFSSSGAALSPSGGYSGGGIKNTSDLFGIAVDPSGNAWVSDKTNDLVAEFKASDGSALSPSTGFTGGGINSNNPIGIASDGAGNIWVANDPSGSGGGSVTELDNSGTALSPSTGFTDSHLANPEDLAIDSSGNVWVTENTASGVTEFIGPATPITTPLNGPPQTP